MTDTFFDLQRFAAATGVIVGGQSSFSWKDGETFGPAGESVAVGTTESNAAFLLTSGGVSTAGNANGIWLGGEKTYSFSLDGKDDWSLKLSTSGTAHITNSDGLALDTLNDTVAALNVNGTFEETVNDNAAYIKTAAATKATLRSVSSLLTEIFAKNTSDVDIVVGGGITAEFAKGATNINVGTAKNSIKSGFAFEKAATVGGVTYNSNELSISTENNNVTLANGDVWAIKKSGDEYLSPSIYYNIANNATDSVLGIKNATITSVAGIASPLFVGESTANGTLWNSITGGISTVSFDSVGSANVANDGAVNANGADGAKITIQNLDTTGSTVNGIKVQAVTADVENIAFELETAGTNAGLSAITLKSPAAITVNKDEAFDVNIGKANYGVATSADAVSLSANASGISLLRVETDESYTVSNGNALFTFQSDTKNATLNGARVSVSNGEGIIVTSEADDSGISNINFVGVDEKVSVSNDDVFSASFSPVTDDGVHIFKVNDASIRAGKINGQTVSISVSGNDVTVTGMANTKEVSVAGATGLTYHFKDATGANAISPSSGESLYVTLDSSGGISDYMDEANYKKLMENDKGKWDNVASVGNQDNSAQPVDTVPGDLSTVFNQFYNLGTSDAGQNTLASFVNENSTDAPSTVANTSGVTFYGRDGGNLATEAHVALSTGSSVGAAPINVQKDENANVVDVVIDQRNSTVPSTIAIGTLEDTDNYDVTASHTIYLSNVGTGYVNVGEYATGQNRIFAGTGGAQIRHDVGSETISGSNGDKAIQSQRATIVGNTGNDTIWAAKDDIVYGGAGANQFYDSASYTIRDYDASTGDALIATRLASIDDVTKANLNFDADEGNKIGFGTSNKKFTINDDQNAALGLKVAVMDSDARIVATRNVAVAGINGGLLDASGFTDGGALIVADAYRNGNSGDVVTGTATNDTIYVGANDTIIGSAGNDAISIDSISSGDAGAVIILATGKDTVSNWTFGFDRNAGATELFAADGFYGSFENDRLLVTAGNGSILFDDTRQTALHGEYDVLINDSKYMAIRTNDVNNTNPASYGDVLSNDDIADIYIAEREGILSFGAGVTENLGVIELDGGHNYDNPARYQNISYLALGNNSKASVFGTSDRETVALGGYASAGANKAVSLGSGNDVIYSTGDSTVTAGNQLYFGASDGRDTIVNFSHYLGVDVDPDVQYADTLIIENYGGIYTGIGEDGGKRIEFITGGDNRIFLYETDGISTENMYQIKVGAANTKLAKIGNSDGSNNFAYDSKVAYYVGNSADNAKDTLTVGNEVANANIWLDGTAGTNTEGLGTDEEYYRGIAVVDASAETDTTVILAGNGANNTLIGGGDGTYNSLWGGAGNNVLIGSATGQDTFYYVRNAGAWLHGVDNTVTGGNDTIYNFSLDTGDVVRLNDTSLSDIVSTEVTDNSVVLNFNTGGSLTVEGTGDVRFLLGSGESYVTNKESSTENKWTRE